MVEKIGIVSSQRGWHTRALEDALRRQGITPAFFHITRLAAWINGPSLLESGEERIEDCQAMLVRTIPIGSLEQIIFRMDALQRLERANIRVVNSARSIERTVDKYYTSSLLAEAGIATPRTLVTEDFKIALAAFEEFGDAVVKPLFGSEGKGMVRVSDLDSAYRVFRSLELNRYVFYVQEYIPHHNQDYRAFVIGDRVMAAMRRYGDSWKTNFSQGAAVEPVRLSSELEEISVQASRLVGTDYAGIDLLPGEDGRIYVLEVNSIPGWRGIRKTISFDMADCIVEHVIEQVYARRMQC